jgi:hypothetical protein
MTNTSTTAQIYPTSGITTAVVGDMNINPETWGVYECTVAGVPTVAEWLYKGNIKGESGSGAGDMLASDYVGASATKSVHAADTLNTTLGNVDQLNSSDFQVVSSVLEIKDSVKDINAFGATTTLADSNTVAVSLGANSNRKITWANIKAILKSYFDTIYSTFSGSYNDLTDKPTIPAAQVNADWNANSGVAQILNKPTIPTITDTYSATSSDGMSGKAVAQAIGALDKSDSAVSGQYVSAVSETDGIITVSRASLPTIPTVNNGQLTIQQNGTNKATFTANQSGNATANIITDTWTETKTVSSSGTVSFSGLNDSYGYKIYYTLPSGDSAYTCSKVTKTGSGTSVTLTFTTDAPSGTVCKLRILK